MQHTYINRAHLKGYRNIQDTEATFREGLNIVIGPNGCGKSNFLWLLANRENQTLDFEYSVVLEYCVDNFDDIDIYRQIFTKIREIKNKASILTLKQHLDLISDESDLWKYTLDDKTESIYDKLQNTTLLLNFNLPNIIPCFSEGEDISINAGTWCDFHSKNPILNNLFKNEFNFDFIDFDIDIIKQVADYTPIKNIRVKNRIHGTRDNDEIIKMYSLLYEFQTEDAEWYVWNELSDGTRRIVWLILNILTTNKNVILIEEPELGIHPEQLFHLMEFIKEQSERKQFIITTHSPEVLDVLDSDELDRIKIARYDAERKTTVIDGIPAERQVLIQEYMEKTGLLSGYWLHANLEGVQRWK